MPRSYQGALEAAKQNRVYRPPGPSLTDVKPPESPSLSRPQARDDGFPTWQQDRVIDTALGHQFRIVVRDDKVEVTVTSELPSCLGYRFAPTDKNDIPAFYTQIVYHEDFPIPAYATRISRPTWRGELPCVPITRIEDNDVVYAMI